MVTLPTYYQQYIHLSHYARWREADNRRETWDETVDRYLDFICDQQCAGKIDAATKAELRSGIVNLQVMPSMRCMMTAGPALERDNVAGFGCTAVAIDDVAAFDEICYVMMCGCGAGFSVERQVVAKLPTVADTVRKSKTVIKVEDSRIGWANALRELISMLYQGRIPEWDLSAIRPAGAKLKVFGGRASGSLPLDNLFRFCVETFKAAAGRKLTSMECHDLVCKIGEIVQAGGTRRSATISLTNPSDDRMRYAKSGNWFATAPWRSLANISSVYTEKPGMDVFFREWLALYESKSGERGIFNRAAAKAHMKKVGTRDTNHDFLINPCITGETVVCVADDRRYVTIKELAEADEDVHVFCYDADGHIVTHIMRHPRITGKDMPISRVALSGGYYIRCTSNHKLRLSNGRYVEVSKLRHGDAIDISGEIYLKESLPYCKVTSHGDRSRDNVPYARKCEICGASFDVTYATRELAYCSSECERVAISDTENTPATAIPNYSYLYVMSVAPDGVEDVYNGTVDEVHNFLSVCSHAVPGTAIRCFNSKNCGEVILRSESCCNLSEVIVREEDTVKTLKDKVRLATIMGTMQATLTNFRYLRAAWKKNAEEEALLGVSLTGIMDNALMSGQKGKTDLAAALDELHKHAIAVNKYWAKILGINPAAAVTTNKPAGNTSQQCNCASGIHPRYSDYYIRTVRGDVKDPITKFLIDMGIPNEPDASNPSNTLVFSFPIKSPDNCVTRDAVSALDQLEIWNMYHEHWCCYQPSCTVYVKEAEWMEVGAWVYKHFDHIGGLSFLPYSDHSYVQAPYQEIDKKTYEAALAKMPATIDWSLLSKYEQDDSAVTATRELSCSGNSCELVDVGTK